MKLPVPLEEEEQIVLVEWLELHNLKFSAIPNSTYTKSWKQKIKNKRMGLRPGLPDLLVIVNDTIVFIELKRRSGGVVSPEQKEWQENLNRCNDVHSYICKGASAAIAILETYL